MANLEAVGGTRAAGFAGDGAENSLWRGRVTASRASPRRCEVGLRAGWPEFGPRRRVADTRLPGWGARKAPAEITPSSSRDRRNPQSTSHEGQSRREAPHRERRVAFPRAQLGGRVTVGGDEGEVGVPQLAADGFRRGMDGRRGGLLRLGGLAQGVLGEDCLRAEGLYSGALSLRGGLRVDVHHQRGGPSLPMLRRQVLPAGERGELKGLAGRILEGSQGGGRVPRRCHPNGEPVRSWRAAASASISATSAATRRCLCCGIRCFQQGKGASAREMTHNWRTAHQNRLAAGKQFRGGWTLGKEGTALC